MNSTVHCASSYLSISVPKTSADGHNLSLKGTGGYFLPLEPLSETKYFYRQFYVPIVFDRDKERKVNQLLWAGQYPFKKIIVFKKMIFRNCPGGTPDISPAIHRWGKGETPRRPSGTLECSFKQISGVPLGRISGSPPGNELPG